MEPVALTGAFPLLVPPEVDEPDDSPPAWSEAVALPPSEPNASPAERNADRVDSPWATDELDSDGAERLSDTGNSIVLAEELPALVTPTPELRAVEARVDQIVRGGYHLAEKGAIYSARTEFVEALKLLAGAHDSAAGCSRHAVALDAALTALREAADFLPRGSSTSIELRARDRAARHTTPLLHGPQAPQLSANQAAARYYTFAQEQLAYATGQSRVGAAALYGLGRIAAKGSTGDAASDLASAGPALVYFQASLMVDPSHYRAAHETGVLLAQCGRLDQARQMLQRAVAISPQATTWTNLAIVHERLGERKLAAAARQQAAQLGGQPTGDRPHVRWVEAREFSRVASAPEGDFKKQRSRAKRSAATPC